MELRWCTAHRVRFGFGGICTGCARRHMPLFLGRSTCGCERWGEGKGRFGHFSTFVVVFNRHSFLFVSVSGCSFLLRLLCPFVLNSCLILFFVSNQCIYVFMRMFICRAFFYNVCVYAWRCMYMYTCALFVKKFVSSLLSTSTFTATFK